MGKISQKNIFLAAPLIITQDRHPRKLHYEKLHKYDKKRLLLGQEDLKKEFDKISVSTEFKQI